MDKAEAYLEHIRKLLWDNDIPELQQYLAEQPLFVQIHNEIKTIREATLAFSSGDFSPSISTHGIIPRCLKKLQKHLLSLNERLRREVAQMETLKESEARFKFLANHDPLTGIFNRRSFIEMVELEFAKSITLSVPCCLAMMDIDHFKLFNDTYGHPAGDKALKHVVNTLETGLRKNDFMGRYGGEEFTFFFFGANEETGFMVLERLRNKLAETPVALENGLVPIYASFGLAESSVVDSKDPDCIQKLITAADTALYAAKKAGRNRTMAYTQEQAEQYGGEIPVIFEVESTDYEKETKSP